MTITDLTSMTMPEKDKQERIKKIASPVTGPILEALPDKSILEKRIILDGKNQLLRKPTFRLRI